jgi:hypothetical protein
MALGFIEAAWSNEGRAPSGLPALMYRPSGAQSSTSEVANVV